MSRNRSGPSEVNHTDISCARFDATFERWIREATLLLGPLLKPETVYTTRSGMKRDFGDLTMKAQLILIASALLLVSNVAGAQEPSAPSAGAQEQQAPTAKMTGQDTMGHMGGGMMGGEDTMGHMGGGMMCHGMKGHGMMGHGMFKRMIFALMDTDGDGTLSLEEFQAAHAKIFKAMDTNKDGKLTPAEIEAFMSGGSPAPNQ
jgi:EF hand domain-containing protein